MTPEAASSCRQAAPSALSERYLFMFLKNNKDLGTAAKARQIPRVAEWGPSRSWAFRARQCAVRNFGCLVELPGHGKWKPKHPPRGQGWFSCCSCWKRLPHLPHLALHQPCAPHSFSRVIHGTVVRRVLRLCRRSPLPFGCVNLGPRTYLLGKIPSNRLRTSVFLLPISVVNFPPGITLSPLWP